MAQKKCPNCQQWYDDSESHVCNTVGGSEDLRKVREGSEVTKDDTGIRPPS